jgi:uncharacterized protein YcbX
MNGAHPLASLTHLWRYPTKSLAAEPLERAHIGAEGLDGDRRRALFVTTPDHARSGKTFRGKEHNRLHLLRDSDDAVALAGSGGVALECQNRGPYFDAQPVSVLLDTWLGQLEALLGFALDPLRFRPNLFARASGPVPEGPALVGALLRAGSVELRVVAPIVRCVTPSYDVASGKPNPELQRALVQHLDNQMGVYCTVERAGSLAPGDVITMETA